MVRFHLCHQSKLRVPQNQLGGYEEHLWVALSRLIPLERQLQSCLLSENQSTRLIPSSTGKRPLPHVLPPGHSLRNHRPPAPHPVRQPHRPNQLRRAVRPVIRARLGPRPAAGDRGTVPRAPGRVRAARVRYGVRVHARARGATARQVLLAAGRGQPDAEEPLRLAAGALLLLSLLEPFESLVSFAPLWAACSNRLGFSSGH
jgi:hypothetical protein